MTQIPAGWYPDPAAAEPAAAESPAASTGPARQRYWDGQRWTDLAQDDIVVGPTRQTRTTPDGEPLAGWWQRVGAALLDFLIALPLIMVAFVPVIVLRWEDLKDYYSASPAAQRQMEDPLAVGVFSPTGLLLTALLVGLYGAYTIGFWRWKQATPGKLVVGLRVRRRDHPGTMPAMTMVIRFAVMNALFLSGVHVVVDVLLSLFLLLNYLWPLWDDNCQALHDKAAGTNVVRRTR